MCVSPTQILAATQPIWVHLSSHLPKCEVSPPPGPFLPPFHILHSLSLYPLSTLEEAPRYLHPCTSPIRRSITGGPPELDVGELLHLDTNSFKLGPRGSFPRHFLFSCIALLQTQAKDESSSPKHRSTSTHDPHRSFCRCRQATIPPNPTLVYLG